MRQLREKIGFVTQDTQLFSGTIRENLLFVNPKATDEECLAVLKKAACEPLLARADKGLDTVIGEGGVKVSGGEKQRLAFVRAIIWKPRLLLLDEPFSALDESLKATLYQNLLQFSTHSNIPIIIVTHDQADIHAIAHTIYQISADQNEKIRKISKLQ